MSFLTDLARLREAATKWEGKSYSDIKDDPLWTKRAAADVVEYTTYLVNHSEAIEELVRAAEKIVTVDNRIEANNAFHDIKKALEKLNRSE